MWTLNGEVHLQHPAGRRGAARPAPAQRYKRELFVSVNNLTNHANLTGFSGVMTSPFFMTRDRRPESAQGRYRAERELLNTPNILSRIFAIQRRTGYPPADEREPRSVRGVVLVLYALVLLFLMQPALRAW